MSEVLYKIVVLLKWNYDFDCPKIVLSIYYIFWKASVICGCIGVIAEVSYEALKKRYDQGWVCEMIDDVDALIQRIREARKNGEVHK